jgi:hypothetical protein
VGLTFHAMENLLSLRHDWIGVYILCFFLSHDARFLQGWGKNRADTRTLSNISDIIHCEAMSKRYNVNLIFLLCCGDDSGCRMGSNTITGAVEEQCPRTGEC